MEKEAEARILVVELEDLVLRDRVKAAVDFTGRALTERTTGGANKPTSPKTAPGGKLFPELRNAHASFSDEVQPVGRIAFAEHDFALAMSLLRHVGEQRIGRLAAARAIHGLDQPLHLAQANDVQREQCRMEDEDRVDAIEDPILKTK